ncbi:MAG: riboflavin synthase [Bacteroidota bacterium]
MFTGIIESLGRLEKIEKEKSNVHFSFYSSISQHLKVDQSLAHNGVCLTVVSIVGNVYTVTAIEETLLKTNLGQLKVGDEVNLERCMPANGRFDGHIVQGHVDTTATCTYIKDLNGSWEYTFEHEENAHFITVQKGSITINGVSLTVVQSSASGSSVCIIPYTYENTSFKNIKVGNKINLEFDVIGKYVARLLNIK